MIFGRVPTYRDSPFLVWRERRHPACGPPTSCRRSTLHIKTLHAISTIEHKQKGLPRFVCILMSKVDSWKLNGTTTVEVTMNGVDIGRRSLKRWDDRNCWFMDLADAACRKADIETGDRVKLSLKIASEELPAELAELIRENSQSARPVGTSHARAAAHVARRNSRRQTTGHSRPTRGSRARYFVT
jgi:hypothetical protein